MKDIKVADKTATISIIEGENAFRLKPRFMGYSKTSVRKMIYSYIERTVIPNNWYHHKPQFIELPDGNQTKHIATVICYGNVTVVDVNGTVLYQSAGLPIPEPPKEVKEPIPVNPNITLKMETTDKVATPAPVTEPVKIIDDTDEIEPPKKNWCYDCNPPKNCHTGAGFTAHVKAKHPKGKK